MQSPSKLIGALFTLISINRICSWYESMYYQHEIICGQHTIIRIIIRIRYECMIKSCLTLKHSIYTWHACTGLFSSQNSFIEPLSPFHELPQVFSTMVMLRSSHYTKFNFANRNRFAQDKACSKCIQETIMIHGEAHTKKTCSWNMKCLMNHISSKHEVWIQDGGLWNSGNVDDTLCKESREYSSTKKDLELD